MRGPHRAHIGDIFGADVEVREGVGHSALDLINGSSDALVEKRGWQPGALDSQFLASQAIRRREHSSHSTTMTITHATSLCPHGEH